MGKTRVALKDPAEYPHLHSSLWRGPDALVMPAVHAASNYRECQGVEEAEFVCMAGTGV